MLLKNPFLTPKRTNTEMVPVKTVDINVQYNDRLKLNEEVYTIKNTAGRVSVTGWNKYATTFAKSFIL